LGIDFVYLYKTNLLYLSSRVLFLLFFTILSWQIVAQSDIEKVKITYVCINKPLNIVLKEISQKSNINITFSESKINFTRRVNVNAKNQNLIGVLEVILKPYRLEPEIVENSIAIVTAKEVKKYLDYTISGYIYEGGSKEPLPHTAIYLSDGSVGVYSNEEGFYSLKLKRGNYKILYNYVGFKEDTIQILLRRDSTANRYLKPIDNKLNEVVVKEDLNKRWLRKGEDYINKSKIHVTSSLTGESDIMRSLNLMSGITSGGDGFGGQSIRGGNTDQNLIILDGVPLQNTGHGFGMVSIFNSDVIQDARLYKSAIPSKYSGRLSSVLDIKTINGNSDKLHGTVSVSSITSKATLHGPLGKNATFIVSGRRTFTDLWIKSLSRFIAKNNDPRSEGETNYFFTDVTGKLNFKYSDKTSLSILMVYANDDFDSYRKKIIQVPNKVEYINQTSNKLVWGNMLGSIILDRQINNNAFAKLTLHGSKWSTKTFGFERNAIDSLGNIEDIYSAKYRYANFENFGARYDYSLQANKLAYLKFGVGGSYNNFRPTFNSSNNLSKKIFPDSLGIGDLEKNLIFQNNLSYETFAYGEAEINFSAGSNLTVGFHGSRYATDSLSYFSIQPRLSFNLSNEYSWMTASITSLRQHQQALAEDGLGFPTNVWVSSTSVIKPADGINYSLNLGLAKKQTSSINMGVYYKTMKNIITLGEGETLTVESDKETKWQASIPRGTGIAYGLELGGKFNFSKFNFDVNANYGKSTRKFLDVNNAQEFDFNLDRRFYGTAVLGIKLGENSFLNFSGVYGMGAKVSAPEGLIAVYEVNGQKVLSTIYKTKNGYIFPDLFRLDFGYTTIFGNKGKEHKIFLGVYNLTNKRNPIYLKLGRNTFDINSYDLSSVSLFPLLPAISYSYSF
jgi:hypothetical protein